MKNRNVEELPVLTIFTVATDRYIEFWCELAKSVIQNFDSTISIQWFVFTNRKNDIPDELLESRIDLMIIETQSLGWPLPTLLRYQMIKDVEELVKGDLVMHLDADMLCIGTVDRKYLYSPITKNQICFVEHPGFFRPCGRSKFELYLKNLIYILRDLKSLIRFGSLGTWDRDPESQAFVPRRLRGKYVCGGTWYGEREAILKLANELASRTDQDLRHGKTATFHDESHLNWFYSTYGGKTVPPELCFEPTYPQLRGLNPKIVAINKNELETWKR